MIVDLVRFGVKIDEKDKVIILLCSFPGLTYEKDTTNIDVINASFLYHSKGEKI